MDTIDLTATAREQSEKAGSQANGRAAKTVYGGSDTRLRQTVIALASGQELAEHENPGEATVHVLSGRVRLAGATTSAEGGSGDLLVVPREKHSLAALEDSTVLLTAVTGGRAAGA